MSNTTPVRTVIVGCGMIAAGGYQPRCQAYPHRIELVGYYDKDEARATALAETSGGRIYKSLEEVLNDANVEGNCQPHYPYLSLPGLLGSTESWQACLFPKSRLPSAQTKRTNSSKRRKRCD